MRDADQAARAASMTSGQWETVEALDKRHTTRIKELIAEIGWPTISKVGNEGSTHAWLLVQHADLEPEFQKECLTLMKQCARKDIDILNIIYLEDRILSFAGKPQLYGTQFFRKGKDAPYQPYPSSDPETLDERRGAVGLEPMEEVIVYMNKKYMH